MLQTTKTSGRTMLTISAVAGLALSVSAVMAMQNQGSRQDGVQRREQDQSRTYVFQSADKLLDMTLTNAQGDELADIDDMVINRGTGRIEAIVIREGGFLGFGGTHVAVPFDAFNFDLSSQKLTLNASADLLEGEDTTLPTGWQRLEDDWNEDLGSLTASKDAMRFKEKPIDPTAQTKTVSGTITEIDRIDLGDTQHWLAVRVDESGKSWGDDRGDKSGNDRGNKGGQGKSTPRENETSGQAQKQGTWVVLGPAWYATGAGGAPVRGQKIEVVAFMGYGDKLHAKTATLDGEEVRYRTDRMEPLWTSRVPRSASEWSPTPMVLLTDVLGENVVWGQTDEEVGEVTDAILETTTGNLALLAVDPDGDWWGQDEGPRAVPFDIARIGQDHISLDATRAMLGGAKVLPSDMQTMTIPRTHEAVFVVFEVSPPRYNR